MIPYKLGANYLYQEHLLEDIAVYKGLLLVT